MKRFHNWMAPMKRAIVTVCMLLLAANFADAQTSTVSSESSTNLSEISSISTQELGVLKSSTESSVGCPHCNIVEEMPMELADKINLIDDPLEFMHEFVDSNSLENVTSLAHPRDQSRRRRAAKDQVKQATCKPIETIVSTVPADDRDPTVFHFPSCVLVSQCGGCCAHTGTTCSPTEETERQISVKRTKYAGGSKLVAIGDITVTVKVHTKCRCQCKKTASDCNSLQRFVTNQCRCECLNIAEAEQCAQTEGKLWDNSRCACVCRDTRECATGQEFNQSTCSCQNITDDDDETQEYPFFGDHTYNETFEAVEDTKYETIPATE